MAEITGLVEDYLIYGRIFLFIHILHFLKFFFVFEIYFSFLNFDGNKQKLSDIFHLLKKDISKSRLDTICRIIPDFSRHLLNKKYR